MEILSGLEAIPDHRLQNPIVTWGVFDGVHRGHRRVAVSRGPGGKEEDGEPEDENRVLHVKLLDIAVNERLERKLSRTQAAEVK